MPTTWATDDILTPADLCAWFKLENEAAVYELVRPRAKPPLPSFKIGKYLRFHRGDCERWLAAKREQRLGNGGVDAAR